MKKNTFKILFLFTVVVFSFFFYKKQASASIVACQTGPGACDFSTGACLSTSEPSCMCGACQIASCPIISNPPPIICPVSGVSCSQLVTSCTCTNTALCNPGGPTPTPAPVCGATTFGACGSCTIFISANGTSQPGMSATNGCTSVCMSCNPICTPGPNTNTLAVNGSKTNIHVGDIVKYKAFINTTNGCTGTSADVTDSASTTWSASIPPLVSSQGVQNFQLNTGTLDADGNPIFVDDFYQVYRGTNQGSLTVAATTAGGLTANTPLNIYTGICPAAGPGSQIALPGDINPTRYSTWIPAGYSRPGPAYLVPSEVQSSNTSVATITIQYTHYGDAIVLPTGNSGTTNISIQGPNSFYYAPTDATSCALSPVTLTFGPTPTPTPTPTVSNVTATMPNYCSSGPGATISWTYSGSSAQSAYQVQVDTNGSSFSPPVFDSGKVSGAVTSYFASGLAFNTTYKSRVKVWDSFNLASAWANQTTCNGTDCQGGGGSWKTPKHAYPLINFTWSPGNPIRNQPVQFTDQTTFFDGGGARSWNWLFKAPAGSPNSTLQNPTYTYVSNGTYNVTNTATDKDAYTCSLSKPINIQISAPVFKEVAPK